MQSIAFALPVTPGRTEEWRAWISELTGEQRSEYEESRRRLGVLTERAYLQHTPQGDFVVVYLEGEDLPHSFEGIASSSAPFDVSFRQRAKDLFSGLDLSQPPSEPLSEQVLEGVARF